VGVIVQDGLGCGVLVVQTPSGFGRQ